MSTLLDDVERHRLARRLDRAVARLEDPATPLVVVDVDAFDANADDLVRRASGKPVRLATKSVRIPALIERALGHAGFAGALTYQLREALWLVAEDLTTDAVMGYPSVDRTALGRLLADERSLRSVTLMIDDVAHLDVVDAQRLPEHPQLPVRIAIDIDAGLRMGTSHVGPKRSPLFDAPDVVGLARAVMDRPGFSLVGVMTYEGQVAGVPDTVPNQKAKSLVVRKLKQASVAQLNDRRAQINDALRAVTELEFWNAGGSGSVESTVADPVVTEVAAGSGLLVPGLFDHYESFRPQPAAFYGLPVVRRPSPTIATVAGGGFAASGAAGKDRLPIPWAPPGLQLTGLEGAGEVQTPLSGPGAAQLVIGDLVWFRHAKAGELAEHTNVVHLLLGERIRGSAQTYRGLGTRLVTVTSKAFDELDPVDAYAIWRLRQEVFVVEQECVYPDLDGRDLEPATRHLTLTVDDTIAGYLRILDDGDHARIGRVLLAKAFRGRGLADVLMTAAVAEIGVRPSVLDAQAPLARWYAGFGYAVSGPEFLEDGIAHVPMSRS